jgi:Helix-turn-helix family
MTEMTALEAVVAAKGPIGSLGGAWMTSDAEEQATVDAGLEGWQLYFLGRHGVLGDVDADVVLASAYVFPADHLRREWDAARTVMAPDAAVTRYLGLLHDWGREHLGGFGAAERLAELGQRVIDASDVVALPLFAGWRALPVPTSAPERCAHVCQVLREHRGACHGVVLAVLQMAPLTAILTNIGGEANALDYGWEPPFPEPTDADRAVRVRVEELTDVVAAPAYDVLDEAERAELVSLLDAAAFHVFG